MGLAQRFGVVEGWKKRREKMGEGDDLLGLFFSNQ